MLTMTNGKTKSQARQWTIAEQAKWRERVMVYADWAHQNPHVVHKFSQYALDLIAKGRGRAGAQFIWQMFRWETNIAETKAQYKLNNDNVALLSRHFILNNPEHKGFFRQRTMHGEPSSFEASQEFMRNALHRQQGFLF